MKNKKGFTLAELLIVVAIIAVLVAIAIPIFSAQLEKSREATDIANIRAAYAEVVANALDRSGYEWSTTVLLKQEQENWQTDTSGKDIAGVALPDIKTGLTGTELVGRDREVYIKYHPAEGAAYAYVTIGGDTSANKTYQAQVTMGDRPTT